MDFRFQRRITLAPGIRLNLSRRGFGLSVGPRGGSLSVGPNGVHGHAGIPGTGLAYRQKLNVRLDIDSEATGSGRRRFRCNSLACPHVVVTVSEYSREKWLPSHIRSFIR